MHTGQGVGSLGFYVGDVDGDGRVDVIHPWQCDGRRVCILYYLAANGFNPSPNVVTGQGTGRVAGFLTGDIYGDSRTSLIQLWNCDNNLCVIYYTSALGFESGNYKSSQGTGAVAYLTGDIDGSGRTSVIHLWNSSGRLSILWYTPKVNSLSYQVAFSSNAAQVVAVSSAIVPQGVQDGIHVLSVNQ